MKSETESKTDDLVQSIGELAKDVQKLARVAVQQYSAEVETILKALSRDSRCIERCLDGMLDFCFDDEMLVLYKKLCRYYYDIDPEATVSYVNAYREMWDEENPHRVSKGPLGGETRHKPDKRDKLSPTTKGDKKGPKEKKIMIPKECNRMAEVDFPIAVDSKHSAKVGSHHTVRQAREGLR